MATIEELKKIPIKDVAWRLGLELQSNKMHCFNPAHDDRKTPSLSFNFNENYFYCFGCRIGGSTIDLVKSKRECSRREAILWLSQEFGFSPRTFWESGKKSNKPKKVDKKPDNYNLEKSYPDPEVYIWILENAKLPDKAKDYLNGRGFSDKTISHFKIGGSLKPKELILNAEKHFSSERLHKAGLLMKSKKNGALLPIWWEPIVIVPFLNLENNVVYLQARTIGTIYERKYIGLASISKPLFNLQIINELHQGTLIYIVEGIMDVLAAYENNMWAVGVLGSTTQFKKNWALALSGYYLNIIPDKDPPGMQLKDNIVQTFADIGKSVDVQYLPNGFKDLSDFISAHKKGVI